MNTEQQHGGKWLFTFSLLATAYIFTMFYFAFTHENIFIYMASGLGFYFASCILYALYKEIRKIKTLNDFSNLLGKIVVTIIKVAACAFLILALLLSGYK